MEQYFIQVAIGLVIAVLGFLLKNKIEKMEKDISTNTLEIKEIKENYLDRFEKLNVTVNKRANDLSDKMHELQITLMNKLNEKN